MKTRILTLATYLTCLTALAQEMLIDQQDVIAYPYTIPLGASGSTAQEFTPSLNAIDFVDLFITPTPRQPPLPAAAFTVSIRNGSISGAVLGVSQAVTVGSPATSAPTRFVFSNSVPLVLGSVYVWVLDGDGFPWSTFYDPYATYSGGRAILGGIPTGVDLWFREGVAHPPLTVARLGLGQVQLSWPTNFTNYSLQCSTTLPATNWSTSTSMVSETNGQFSVTVGGDAEQRFFRLSKPSG